MDKDKLKDIIDDGTAASNAPTIHYTKDKTAEEIEQISARFSKIEKRVKYLENENTAIITTTAAWFTNLPNNSSDAKKIEEIIQLNTEKKLLKENAKILSEIGQYEENWNGYGAEKINQNIIFKTLDIITSFELKCQPEIFPTASGTVQLEYEPSTEHYLEIEILHDRYVVYQRIGENTITQEITEDIKLFNIIDEFQSQFRNNR
ncbi:MAG: hypothetical protein D8M26_00805 [Ignavibacteriae bacterium]|nr:hypothetical protein [Ignavibacteriota bacterium]